MLPPRLAARWAAAQIKDLVATKTPHNNHSPITLHVALYLLDFLADEGNLLYGTQRDNRGGIRCTTCR